MQKVKAAWAVAIAVLVWPGVLAAHHSLVQFDTTTPVHVKGTVVRWDMINPHARIHVDQAGADGQTQRWVVEGPAPNALTRLRIGQDFLKPGDVIEVCGFPLKDLYESQRASAPNPPPGKAFSGHLLVMPDGKRQYWSDYGVLE